MNNFEKMRKEGERLEKFVKWFIAFVFVMIILSWIGQGLIAAYFIKNPDAIGGWIGDLLQGFDN
ncbi:hypothetical protein AAGS61_02910 [Lysinibacillus sp. KU-BSD001]|uniref:DUF7248 family protein n=1 Tax=Lysinibacillus sp. KU-BSD001 TaxID=3141328 RepID=UPI0036E5C827